MKTIKQLLRQPLKTVFGIILITLSVAILCVSVGQALAVRTTTEKLNRQFSTVAIPLATKTSTLNTIKLSASVNDDLLAWLDQIAMDNPDIVKQISRHGILSAYIHELTPLNITEEKYIYDSLMQGNMGFYFYQAEPYAMPYSCAMLVITLEEVSEPEELTTSYIVEDNLSFSDFASYSEYKAWFESVNRKTVTQGYTVKLTGTVTDVISLQEGYRDPVGRIARLTFTAPTLEQIEALNLIPGEQYVVYGMDYVDEYWKLIGELNLAGRYDWVNFDSFNPLDLLEVMDDWEIEKYQKYYELYENEEFRDAYARFFGIIIDKREYEMVNAISMTLAMPISLTEYNEIRNEAGILQDLTPHTEVTYTDTNGETIILSNEEYTKRYKIPTIAHLDGSVDDFLNSSQGAFWKNAMMRDVINNQAFAVIGVDNMNYLADFSLQNTKIVEGRDFTAEELDGGTRVCIIHGELAVTNGIAIGDTITVSFYTTDQGIPYQKIRSSSKGLLNPTASFYYDTTPFTETAEYTVVGICRGERTFPDVEENQYEFSANTVYVPKSSVQTPMETYNSVVFVTPVIQNGKLNAFNELAMVSGYGDCFKYNDQGYSVIADNFHNYEELAKQVVTVGIIAYLVIMILFITLYTAFQKKNIAIMKSLGASGGRRYLHVFISSMAIIMLASLIGYLLGVLLWDFVAEMLQKSAETAIALQIEKWTLSSIAGIQLLFALFLNALASILVVLPTMIDKRR